VHPDREGGMGSTSVFVTPFFTRVFFIADAVALKARSRFVCHQSAADRDLCVGLKKFAPVYWLIG
jgi:hypothetical protein